MNPPSTHRSGLFPAMALASWETYLQQVAAQPMHGAAGQGAGGNASAGSAHRADAATDAPPTPQRRHVGERFSPFDGAPTLVVLPPATLMCGAHPQDPDAQGHEQPRRAVALAQPLAVGVSPVTFDEWDACAAAGGTGYKPRDATWGRGQRPVINVSWHDAEEYVGWLSRQTGQRFRLLTEAEWEAACWAAQPQAERYPWSADLGFRQLRHHAWYRDNAEGRTQPVGQLQANPWGLTDLLGNVSEWVQDAYQPTHAHLPADGSPVPAANRAAQRVLKGGSWLDSPAAVRPSARDRYPADHRSYRVGFRVAMELPAGVVLDVPGHQAPRQ